MSTDAVFAPISLAKGTQFVPASYMIHIRECHCTHCGTISASSELYAVNLLRSQWGKGKPVSNLVPVDRFYYNVPVVRKHLGVRKVAACHECGSFDLSHLPSPPEPDRVTVNVLLDPKAKPKPEPKEPKRPATLDELA